MSFDGIVINALENELSKKIINGRIDKIYQPENDEILLIINNNKNNYKLLLSASSSNPRIYLTDKKKENPLNPPMFCMLLRKHIQSGKILNIKQTSLERILNIHIDSYDELGNKKEKILIIEVMGRHSNIILIDKESNLIIDSIKRINVNISTVRQILPGITYTLPPSQEKINPLITNKESFINKVKSFNEGMPIYKILYQSFTGISPLISREILYNSNISDSTLLGELKNFNNLYNSFSELLLKVKNKDFNPYILIDNKNNKMIAFSAIALNHLSIHKTLSFNSISELLDKFYFERDISDRINQKSWSLRKIISSRIEKNIKKLSKLKLELNEANKRDIYKVYGDLIISNLYKIKFKDEELICNNYYNNNELTKIKLDPRLNPSQNAQKYYKRYNKLKNASDLLSKEIIKTKNEIKYLENVNLSLENCSDFKELDEIRQELIHEGYLKNRNKFKIKNNKRKPILKHYISSDGYDIYVGKNNIQNDYLTLKFANKDDIWLHVKDIPGSHVIIRRKDGTIPYNTIFEAANIAAFYSKGKLSSNVPVDYTERKNVKKPNGARPGMVIYNYFKTLFITPDENLIKKLLEKDHN